MARSLQAESLDVNLPVRQLLPLEPGDRLTRPEFERRYEAMPHLKKAELIEGVGTWSPTFSIELLAWRVWRFHSRTRG